MPRRRPSARWSLALAPLLLSACPTAGMHTPGVELVLSAGPAEAAPGDTVRLTASVTNSGDRELTLEFRGACRLAFYVRGPDHRVVHPAGGARPCGGAPAAPVRLAPGETVRETHAWPAADSAGRPLPAGDYVAYAVLDEHYLLRGSGREMKLGHRSAEVPLRLR